MALNPPLLPNRHPAPVQGEYLVLDRKDIEVEIVLENKQKFKGKGKLYLTTLRMVFVNSKNETMTSFDVPIDLMSNEKFNQPIFGANYISGRVLPLYDLLPCPATFKFWFMSGGTGTFLPMFYNITEQIRKRRHNNSYGPDPRFVECVANGNLRNVAYVDPNDPSVIFVQQPASNVHPTHNVNYYFPQPGAVHPPPAFNSEGQVPNSDYDRSYHGGGSQVAPVYNAGGVHQSGPAYNSGYQAAPVYNPSGPYQAAPVYNPPGSYQAAPVYNPPGPYQAAPVYNPSVPYQAAPVYHNAPGVYQSAPVYHPPNSAPPMSYPPARQPDSQPPGYSPPANYANPH